ncbi:MAG: hypothetical protein KatS3mg107_0929 [Gemmataceae bacterium]|jgi:hypothetical protein|nr:MAG: hypothetical protein KatS3mg107_0929 [Gemmataceae bacterium]
MTLVNTVLAEHKAGGDLADYFFARNCFQFSYPALQFLTCMSK